MKKNNRERFLVTKCKEFTNVFYSDKIIEISEDLYNNLNKVQLGYINELKKFKYSLQYFIE